jgi:nucleoside-diphosphate-sugar epimerase
MSYADISLCLHARAKPRTWHPKITMHIAITGATGFLGRYLVRQLAGSGNRLRCWYRPSSGQPAVVDAGSQIEWLPGQLEDTAATIALVRGADAVVHGAVQWQGPRSGGRGSHGAPDVFFGINLTGSLQLFRAAFDAGVRRFIFISSCAVHDVILGDRPLDETHPLWPQSHYGAHKAALEVFVHSFGLGQGWPICALRPTGIYGLAHPPQNSRWYDLVGQVMRGEAIATPKGGKEVHASDVARAVELLLHADAGAITGQSFSCYDRYVAEQEVARIAKELSGSKSEIANLNGGPKNQIANRKLRDLGMTFGGDALLRQTVHELVKAHGA